MLSGIQLWLATRTRSKIVPGGARFLSPKLNLALAADYPIQKIADGVWGEFTLEQQQSASFELHRTRSRRLRPDRGQRSRKLTDCSRRRWITGSAGSAKCTYKGRWREMVHRSALVLKLLVFQPTGAIVAAPTTSLPEAIGGERNWDYRYTWIRDAAFTLYALLRIGFTEEAAQFMSWIEERCHEMEAEAACNIMYGIDGRHDLRRNVLTHLEGYRGSRPVRIGNGAYDQLQLDIYGELMDSVYLYNKHGSPISYDFWRYLRRLTNWVCDNWKKTDEGIWEVRSGRQQFLYSRLMCWVAIDRGLRLADKRSFPADRERWIRVRDEIYEEIQAKGWSTERNAFVQYLRIGLAGRGAV